jgi:hypothetical protein
MKYNGQPLLFGNQICVLFLLLLVISFISGGCNSFQENKTYRSPDGYDLSNPVWIKLPLELDEISGIAFYPADTCVFAINDEFGMLYKIFLTHPQDIQKWKFSDGADFEDLVLLDSVFYVLKSTGDITAFNFLSHDSLSIKENLFPAGSGNEFEILYYDDAFQKLMMICKDCEMDKKRSLSTFTFDPWNFQFTSDSFTIDVKKIALMAGEEKMKFKPSAAGISPVTGELFIISSINKILVIADRNGDAKEVFKIDPGIFKQPEGLTFSPAGALMISNESADQGVANILVFPYNPKQQNVTQ